MNKSDLIKNISLQTDSVKKNDIEESVNQLINFISTSLLEKKRVEIRGFGTIKKKINQPHGFEKACGSDP